jgi:serine/threonine protein kinase
VLKDFFGGTPGFMAPEVLRTKATKPSDIFSLGLTFYYAITGVHPILAELRSRAKSNPDLLKNPTRAIQRIYEEIEYNFDLFSHDQRALVEPMLRINPKERPSLELLIKTASQLEVRFEASPEIAGGHDSNKIYESWSELKPYLENLVRQQGVSGFTVTVDENSQFSLWFKPLTLGDDLYVTCTKPKNSTNLGMIGWTTLDSTIMMKKVPKDPKVIAKEIAKAMEIGFQLKPPIVIS